MSGTTLDQALHGAAGADSGAGLTDDPRDDKIRELEWHNHKLRDQIRALGVDLNNTRAQLQSTQASKTKLGVHCRDLEAQIVTLKARKTDAQYKLELDEADAQIAELRAEVVSLLNDLDEKQNSIADLESRVAMHETSEYKALQKKANVRLAKAAKDLSDSRERERMARRTIQQVTEQLLVSERRCVLLEETLASTEAERAELKEQFAKFKQMHEQTFVDTREKMKELTAGLEEQRHALTRANAKYITSLEAKREVEERLERVKAKHKKQMEIVPVLETRVSEQMALRHDLEIARDELQERYENVQYELAATKEDLADLQKKEQGIAELSKLAKRQRSTMKVLRDQLAEARGRANALGRSQDQAAEAKKEALRSAKSAVGTMKNLKTRVAFLEHKTQREVEARERVAKELLDKCNQVRELKEEIRLLGHNAKATEQRRSPGRRSGQHGSPSHGVPRGGSAAPLNTFDFTGARDDFDTMAGSGEQGSVGSISDGEDDRSADVDEGVDCGEFQLARVGPAGDPTAAVAVLAPQGDDTARRILKASRVNSWLRRVNRRFSGYSVERELLLQHVGKKLAQLLWEKRVMHAKRLMAKEAADSKIAQLTSETDQNATVQLHLKARLDRRQTAKRKLLVHYLASTAFAARVHQLAPLDAKVMDAAAAVAKEVQGLHGLSPGATAAFTPIHSQPMQTDAGEAQHGGGATGEQDESTEGAGDAAVAVTAEPRKSSAKGELHLAGCDLVNSETKVVAAALRATPNIGVLDMRANAIADDGAKALAAFVQLSPTLSRVDLRGNYITDDGLRHLAEAARRNPRTQHVVVTSDGKIEALGLSTYDPSSEQQSVASDADLTVFLVVDVRRQTTKVEDNEQLVFRYQTAQVDSRRSRRAVTRPSSSGAKLGSRGRKAYSRPSSATGPREARFASTAGARVGPTATSRNAALGRSRSQQARRRPQSAVESRRGEATDPMRTASDPASLASSASGAGGFGQGAAPAVSHGAESSLAGASTLSTLSTHAAESPNPSTRPSRAKRSSQGASGSRRGAASKPWTGHRRGQGLAHTRAKAAGGDWMQAQLAKMSSQVEGVDSYRTQRGTRGARKKQARGATSTSVRRLRR